jgi:hypothetical protein
MDTRPSTVIEPDAGERRLLTDLLGLYDEECRVYRRVLDLSREQGRLVRAGAPFAQVRNVLETKRDCLDAIARLEIAEGRSRALWDQKRHEWSGTARARLHQALQEVGTLIEEILLCEEENDRILMAKAKAL